MLLPGWLGVELERVQHLPAGHCQPGEQSQVFAFGRILGFSVPSLLLKCCGFADQAYYIYFTTKGQGSRITASLEVTPDCSGIILGRLEWAYGMPGIEHRSAVCKPNALPTVLSLQPQAPCFFF